MAVPVSKKDSNGLCERVPYLLHGSCSAGVISPAFPKVRHPGTASSSAMRGACRPRSSECPFPASCHISPSFQKVEQGTQPSVVSNIISLHCSSELTPSDLCGGKGHICHLTVSGTQKFREKLLVAQLLPPSQVLDL